MKKARKKARPKKPRRKTNKQLLEAALADYIRRREPEVDDPLNTSHLQSMAAKFGGELIALSMGARECDKHLGEDLVEGTCPRCSGLWPSDRVTTP